MNLKVVFLCFLCFVCKLSIVHGNSKYIQPMKQIIPEIQDLKYIWARTSGGKIRGIRKQQLKHSIFIYRIGLSLKEVLASSFQYEFLLSWWRNSIVHPFLLKFLATLRFSVSVVFNNFLLIDATDRSKISSDEKSAYFSL